MEENITTAIKQLFSDKLDCDLNDIKDDTILFIDLGMDELDYIEIIMEIEERYDIYITDSEIDKCVTIKDFIDLVTPLVG